MAMKNNSERYLVRKPLKNISPAAKQQSQGSVYLSRQQVPEANYYLELEWVKSLPAPESSSGEHIHDYDEVMLFWGSDYLHPQTLGGEIGLRIGSQPITINTSSGIFIPRGVPHGPLAWKKFSRPHVRMSLLLGSGDYSEKRPLNGEIPGAVDLKNRGSDYEQYVVRSPMREAGAEFLRGRTTPTMTFMSGNQIPGVRCYIEFGWTFDMPKSKIAGTGMPEMLHTKFDEIVLHFGGDPDHPEELGGEIEFYVDGQPLRFDTSTVLFLPKGLLHGPLACLKYEKPHIVMAMMIGIGSLQEGWNDSTLKKAPVK